MKGTTFEEDLIRYVTLPTRKRNAFMLGYYTRVCHVSNVDDANPFELKSDDWYAWRRGYWAGDGRGNSAFKPEKVYG